MNCRQLVVILALTIILVTPSLYQLGYTNHSRTVGEVGSTPTIPHSNHVSANSSEWRYIDGIPATYSYPSQYLDSMSYTLKWISGVDVNSYTDREDYTDNLKGSTFWTMKVDYVDGQPHSDGHLYDNQYNTSFSTTENESLFFVIKAKVYMPTFTIKIKAEGMPYWYSYNWISYPSLVNTSDSEYILSYTVTNSSDFLDTGGNIYVGVLVGGEMYFTGSSTVQVGYCRWYIFNRTSVSWVRITDDGPWDTQTYTYSSTTNYVRPISHIVFALDYFSIQYPSSTTYVNHFVASNSTTVLHKLLLYSSIANTRITLSSIPPIWSYWYSEPQVSYDGYRTFTLPDSGEFSVYFISYDTWNYPEYGDSRVAYFNSRGDSLDFDNFHTSIAESPSHLIKYAPDVNDPDLVAWFRFNEGTGTKTYDWKQGLEGTISSGVTWATGYIGDALSFDGSSSDFGTVPDDSSLHLQDEFSVEVWFKFTDGWDQSSAIIFVSKRYSSTRSSFALGLRTHDIISWAVLDADGTTVKGFGSAANQKQTTAGLVPGQWYHMVGTYNKGDMKIYLNGKLLDETTVSYNSIPYASYSLYLGALYYSGVSSVMNGTIDELRIYNRALTPEEVWWHYSLALYYDGEKDMLGRTPNDLHKVTTTQGIYGTAGQFGSDGYASWVEYQGDGGVLSLTTPTFISFFKVSALDSGSLNTIFHVEKHFSISVYSDNQIRINYGVSDSGGWRYITQTVQSGLYDNWHLLIVSFAYPDVYIWVDGQEYNVTMYEPIDNYYSTNFWVGSWGDWQTTNLHTNGLIDEAIVLNQPLSPEMVENLWKVAKQYTGGYYTNTEFKATWPIESDSPEDGNGFSEDFSDISEWVYSSGSTFTTDGDVANWTIVGSATSYYLYHSIWIKVLDYPFYEYCYKTDGDIPYGPVNKFSYDLDGDGVVDGAVDLNNPISLSSDYRIFHINIKEYLEENGVTVNSTTYVRPHFRWYVGSGVTAMLYLDWLRVYGFQGAILSLSSSDSKDYFASIGGVLYGHMTFSSTGNEYISLQYDIPNFDATSTTIAEIRFKGILKVQFGTSDGVIYWWFNASDWAVVQMNLYSRSYSVKSGSVSIIYSGSSGTSNTITMIYLEVNDYPDSIASGTWEFWLDYIRIGYLNNEKLQDTSWQSLLYPIYEHPKSGYVWFNVTDIFGNALIYEPRDYSVYQDFILPVYSWKFANGKDNTFIHINVSRNGFWWSEWLAPHEVAHYSLYSGNYTLRVTYPDSSYFETTITVSQDYYWWLSGNTLGDVLQGIDNLYYNITNVNQTLYNQIINVNISLTNWNSEINSTTVNIYLNLTNVNSTIHTQLVDIQSSITNLRTNVTWQIQNLSIWMDNNFTYIDGQIVTVNNTVLNVNSTLISANNTIINTITNVNNSMTYQFTHVLTNITNVNNTPLYQTQLLKEDINNIAHTEYRQPPPEQAKVPVVGDLVTSEAGQVIAGFGIILAVIFAFMYIVERGRRISIEEERSAKRMIEALKK